MLTSNLFIGMLSSDVLFGGSFPFSISPAPQKHPSHWHIGWIEPILKKVWVCRNLHKNLLRGVRHIRVHLYEVWFCDTLLCWISFKTTYLSEQGDLVQSSICVPPWPTQWQPGQEWTWIQFSLCKVVFSVSVGCSWVWFLLQAAGGGTL